MIVSNVNRGLRLQSLQMLSRTKPALGPGCTPSVTDSQKKNTFPKLEDFLDSRDYTGAIALLEVCYFACILWLIANFIVYCVVIVHIFY